MAPITVLVVDMQPLFADALATSLERWPDFVLLDDRPSTGDAALKAAADGKPDVALVDYWMRGIPGKDVAREIRARVPDTKVIHLAWFYGPNHAQNSLASGAVGYLPKNLRVDQVAEAIHRAVAGECPVFEEETAELLGQVRLVADNVEHQKTLFNSLTTRERDVLRELARGHTADKVARRLGISYDTARTHIRNLLSKTQTSSPLEVVAKARRRGLIP